MNLKRNQTTGILLFVSGISALIYQTLWVKQLGLIVGVDVYAVTTAVSAFFAGLALGGFYFGRMADRVERPFRLVAFLEIGIAALGIFGTLALTRSPLVFVTIQEIAGATAWVLPFLIIGLPAFFMGGTLPALVRCTAPEEQSIAKTSGILYAANTFGAIIGALLVPFILIPAFGIIGTAITAALGNLLVAAGAYLNSKSLVSKQPETSSKLNWNFDAKLALGLYTVAGGIALGYEVIWSQSIAPLLSSRVYAFAVVLATYLTGLVLGSFLYARFADRSQKPWMVFGTLIIGAGATALLIFAGLGPWVLEMQDSIGKAVFSVFESDMIANVGRFIFTSTIILLIPTTLLGAAFPAVAKLVAGPENIGRDIGAVAAFNTAGGILGTLITGFFLVPTLGLVRTLGLLAVMATIVGSIALIRHANQWKASYALSAFAVLIIGIIALQVPKEKLAQLLVEKRGGNTIFYEESAGGTVAVLEQEVPNGSFNRLYIQGVSNSGNSLTSLRYMRLQGLLPLLIHNGEPRSALVIGFGTGITFGSLLSYPDLEKRVCAELLPGVLNASQYFAENQDIAKDSSVEIRVRDGRHELLANPEKYDMITLEPPPPSAAGVVNLYSTEFYELARDRLADNGLLAQWWPLATQNTEDSKSLVRSLLDVFPHVTLWSTELHEALIIGSMEPIEIDVEKIKSRFENPTVSSALEDAGILSSKELIATYMTDRKGLVNYAGDAEPVTDNRPYIEYSGWVRKGEFPRVLTEVAEICSPPNLTNTDIAYSNEVEQERQKLWTLYRAGYFAYMGDEENWEAMLKKIVPELRKNPYYKWFVTNNM